MLANRTVIKFSARVQNGIEPVMNRMSNALPSFSFSLRECMYPVFTRSGGEGRSEVVLSRVQGAKLRF
jgi:hypothetical protein